MSSIVEMFDIVWLWVKFFVRWMFDGGLVWLFILRFLVIRSCQFF